MRSLVFVLGANFLFLYFAWKFSRCWELSVDIQYSHEQFFFHSNWKSDRVSVADIGMADSKKFTPIPKEVREMPRWLKNLGFEASEHQMQVKNNQRRVETYSLFSIYLVGMRWKLDTIMWDKPDWQRYSDNIDDLETNSDYGSDDKEFLQIEWKKQYLVDKDLHLNAQKRFLGLLRNAVQDHPEISFRMETVFKQVSPLDFMQGSRALVMLRRAIRDMIQVEVPKIQSSALGLGEELLADVEISYDGLLSKIAAMETAVETITYGNDDFDGTERLLVQQFVNSGRSHSSPAIASAMSLVHRKGTFTLEFLRQAVQKFVPPTPRKDGAKAYLAKAMSTVASYLGQREQGDQKVQAFMTLVSSEGKGSVQESSSKQGQKRSYSAEEQQKYIRKLQEQNRELRAQVKASRGDGTDSNLPHPPGRRGRGRGRGRGGGRGRARGAGGGVVNAAA